MKNNKGFMMAEVIVVSSIILIFLATLFTSYNQIYSAYKTRLNYYDTNILYLLGYYRDVLIESGYNGNDFNAMLTTTKTSGVLELFQNVSVGGEGQTDGVASDKVLMVYKGNGNLNPNSFSGISLNLTFNDYINYLSKSATIGSNYVMLMERCDEDKTNCKYGYIEIYDGKE